MAAKKRKYNKKAKKSQSIDWISIASVILSIALGAFIYTRSGYVGEGLSDVLGGMMGWLKYIFPLGLLAISIKVAGDKLESLTVKLSQYFLFLICTAIAITVYKFGNGNLNINDTLQIIMQNAYDLGETNVGGGALGALAAVPLIKLFGKFVAVVLSSLLAIIFFAITFGIDLSEKLGTLIEQIVERREERQAELLKRQEIDDQTESPRERRKREREEKKIARMQEQHVKEEEQIKINLNGTVLDDTREEPRKFTQKVNELLKEDKKALSNVDNENPDYIESNLFKKEEEQKEEKTKEVLQLEHTLTVEDENYEYPPLSLLSIGKKRAMKGGAKALTDTAAKLQRTLHSFGVSAKVENVSVGPAITRYELKPAEGVRVSKIANLADDIALNLAAETIRIEAPIPGKQAVRN